MKSSKRVYEINRELKPIMKDFLANRRRDYKQLLECLEQKNWAQIESIAHQLKGSCYSYGFPDMSELGAHLEVLAEQMKINAHAPNQQSILALIELLGVFNKRVTIKYKKAA